MYLVESKAVSIGGGLSQTIGSEPATSVPLVVKARNLPRAESILSLILGVFLIIEIRSKEQLSLNIDLTN